MSHLSVHVPPLDPAPYSFPFILMSSFLHPLTPEVFLEALRHLFRQILTPQKNRSQAKV